MDRAGSPPSRPIKRAACDRCHVLKSRCSRSAGKNETCDRCRRLGIECISSAPLRTGRPRGSGLGLSSTSARASRSTESIPIHSSRDARSRERMSFTAPLLDHSTASLKGEEGGARFDPLADTRTSFAAWQFPHLSNDASSLVGSEFSSSSLDGKNAFDPNCFTPMTTNSEDITIEAPTFPSSYHIWPDLAMNDLPYTETLPPLNQHISHSGDHISVYEPQNSMYRSDSNLLQASNESGMYFGAMGQQQGSVASRSRTQNGQLMAERMSSLLENVNRFRTYFPGPGPTNSLSMVDDVGAVTRAMGDIFAHMSATIPTTATAAGQSMLSFDWAISTMNYAGVAPLGSSTIPGSQCHTVHPFLVQLDSAHACLIHMYSLIVTDLKHSLQLNEANVMSLSQNAPTDPFSVTSNIALGTSESRLHTQSFSNQPATQLQVLGRIVAEMLQKLNISLYDLICIVDSTTVQHSYTSFGHQNSDTHPTGDVSQLATLRSTLQGLLLREEPLLAELRSIVNRL